MRATFEIVDDKVSVSVQGGTLQQAMEILLTRLPYEQSLYLAQFKTLDQKNRLHVPTQILEQAKIEPDGTVIVSYDRAFDCIRVRRVK